MEAAALYSLTRDEAKGLFAAAKNCELTSFVSALRAPENVRSSQRICDVPAEWQVLQTCLNTELLAQSFAGGRELLCSERQIAALVRPDLVPHVAQALDDFTSDHLRVAFGRLEPVPAIGVEALLDLLATTRDFYRRAAEEGNSVLFAAGF
jgi:hypothetical protein